MNKVLVDTSAWICFFKNNPIDVAATFEYLLENDRIVTCPTIIMEVLQGGKGDREFEEVKDSLLNFNVIGEDITLLSVASANLYRSLRKKGVTIRKSNDGLIAATAIAANIPILAYDRDFDQMEKAGLLKLWAQ